MALLIAAPAFAQADPSAYVRARAADAEGKAGSAVAGYAQALANRPDDQVLAMRAYREALAVGDYTLASRAAAVLVRAGTAPPDTALLALAMAVKANDRTATDAALARIAKGPLDFLAPVLDAWVAVDRGEDPFPALAKARSNPLAGRYAAHHRPLLMIAAGRGADAMVSLAATLEDDAESDDLRIDAAALLAVTGKKNLGSQLIAGERPDFALLRKRLGKGVKPGVAFGASRLFLGMAEDIASQDIAVLSILLTRAALLLDPADDRARLYLAEALSKNGANAQALGELGKVRSDSPYRRGASAGKVAVLQRAGDLREALALAKKLADDRQGTAADARTYGDVLAADAQYAAAAAAYGKALGRAGAKSGWELYYLQGSALDKAGQWSNALPALQKAVALGPDQAEALEYLGYAQALRGENLPEAQALLERASKLQPGDADIGGSLGWAYFKQGDAARALPLLEKAVQGDPAGAAVNEHLGDVYWTLGRRFEARYAWNAASIYADAAAMPRIEGKIANGIN